jgi:hypothetical protein
MRSRANRLPLEAVILAVCLLLLPAGLSVGTQSDAPPLEALRSRVVDFAHAIETNNLELALWQVHPHSPQRSEIEAGLRSQLATYLERANTSPLEALRLSADAASARVDQEIVRVIGMKLMREERHSIYHFRRSGESWQIWRIDPIVGL